MPASASAFCWASAPASVTGAIAPASVNGVITTGWLRDAISMMPCNIGVSRRSGELELMTVKIDGSRSSVASSTPRAMRVISMQSMVLLAAEAVAVDVLVGDGQHVEGGVDVAHRGMHVDRLDGIAADEVDRVEHVAELQQIIEADVITGATNTVEADDVAVRCRRCRWPSRCRRCAGCARGSSCAA